MGTKGWKLAIPGCWPNAQKAKLKGGPQHYAKRRRIQKQDREVFIPQKETNGTLNEIISF
jgi:hypothetical protein